MASTPNPNSSVICIPATKNSDDNIRVVNINFCSIRNKKAEFRTFLEITDLDIIMGTETWISSTDFSSEYFPEQYMVYRTDRCTTGGGVLLGIKTRLMSQQVVTPPDVELVMATFTVTKRLSVLIGCCYRPPNMTEAYMHKVTAELRATQQRHQEAMYLQISTGEMHPLQVIRTH